MRRLLLPAVVCAVVVAWPAAASAAQPGGIVVGKLAGGVLVASPTGSVNLFHARAAMGSRVAFEGGRLVVVGHARTARVRGIIVRRIGTTMFLSSNAHLLAIHTGRRLASVGDNSTGAVGDQVTTQVTVNGGELDEQSEDDQGPSGQSSLQITATVTAVGAGTVTLTVNGQTLNLPLPNGLTLPQSVVGQTVTLNISLGDDQGENDDNGGD